MRKTLLFIIAIISIFASVSITFADAAWYVVPVKVQYIDDTYELGFLPLYGEEIRGFVSEDKKTRLIVAFGMNSLSSNEQKWECVDYNFDVINIKGQDVLIIYGDKVYNIKQVEFFFSDKGMVFCSRIGLGNNGIFWDRKYILMKELKMIKRIGEVTHVPGGSY